MIVGKIKKIGENEWVGYLVENPAIVIQANSFENAKDELLKSIRFYVTFVIQGS